MKIRTILICVCVVVAATLGGLYLEKDIAKGKARKEAPQAQVTRRDLVAFVQATGIVKPMIGADVKVGARTPGKVVELPIDVGDFVEKGQIIAKLEQDDLSARVKLQEAILDEARAEEERLAADFSRDKKLAESKSISDQKFDQSRYAYEVAKARVKKAAAELEYAQAQLAYANITSPIKGTVAAVNTIQGETVTTGLQAPTFIRVIDLDRLQVWAYVDENDVGQVKLGQEAVFTVAAYPGIEFKGQVTSIYPSATIQDNVVYYITTVSVDNRERKLMADMTTDVRIFVDKRKDVLTVPNKSVQREGQKKCVYVAKGKGYEKRYIKTGWKDASHSEVLEGLEEGERVALEKPSRS
ncbi:MAG: efflux RND transporter periplasmic adaptor subunit [Thermodesulfobacteriota bacterium]